MSAKTARILSNLFNLIVIIAMFFGPLAQIHVQAYTETNQEDYAPGSVVTVYGDNRNFETGGYQAGENVLVTVTQPVIPDPLTCEAIVQDDGLGSWSCDLQLSSDPALAVGLYEYTTLGLTSGTKETHSFTDANPAANIDQCANGSTGTEPCLNSNWINGNLGASKSRYMEGDSIPYRLVFTNLSLGTHTVTIEWDTTKSSKHAIDYLTTWDRSVSGDPTSGVSGTFGASTAYPIPDDPQVTGAGVTPIPGNFTFYNGEITGVSAYSYPKGTGFIGDMTARITITFTASSATAVLAWGGHISTRLDWGMDASAVLISGSPYHTSLIDLDGKGGNQDLSLATEAVIFPASITIIKQATPEGGTSFPFTAGPAPLVNFSLVDNGTDANTRVFSDITNFTTYTVTENTPAGWTFGSISCGVTSPNKGTQTVDGATVTIVLNEGENVTCTYTNTRNYDQDLTVSKTATASFGRTYKWLIDKSVDDTQIEIAEGGTATFNYSVKVTPDGYTDSAWAVSGVITVNNPNGFDVTGVDVTDAIDNGGECSVVGGTDVTVPANDKVELDYSCTYAAAPDPAAGTNTATATWTAAALYSPNTSASGTAGVDFSAVTPSETNKTITVVDDKTDPLNPVTLGTWNWADGEHTFTYSLDKAGVAGTCTDYTNTAVIDETDQSDSQTVKVCVGKDLTVSKTASAALDRTYKWLIDKSVDETLIKIAQGGTATFNYSVKVTPDGYTDSGWTLGGEITISNPNDWEDISVAVADTLDQGGSCSITETAPYVVPMSGSLTLHYTCTSDGSTTNNHVAVTWDEAAYFTPTGTASNDAAVSFVLSGETNKTITVIDDKTDPENPVTLGTWNWADGEHTFTYSLPKSGVAGTCTDYTNTAVIKETDQSDSQKVTVCVGSDLTVSKTAAGTFDRTYLWSISKDVDATEVKIAEGGSYTFHYTVDVAQTGISDAGWTLSGKITITNPNDWEDITLTGLTDVVDNGGLCTVDPGPYVVPKSGSLDVNYTCSFTSAPTSYSCTNTTYITWSAADFHTPTGAANGSAPFTLAQLGATNQTIHVTDSYGGNLGTVTATDEAPFAAATFTYNRTESGVAGNCTQYDNTATITETDQSASKTVTLCVGKDLTVTKTAEGTFNREYLWEISKDVDKTQINIAYGGTATFNYTVKAWQTGFTDSGWALGGTITVTNPNDWEAITADITDTVDIGGGAVCTVVDGTDVVIPKSSSVTRAYTCDLSTQPSYSGLNTATATWDAAAAFTPNGTASGTAAILLDQLGAKNQTINVTDTLGGSLGSLTATDTEPFTSAEYKYSHGFAGTPGTCVKYDNTATITETGQSASQEVTVCVGLDLTVAKTAAGTFDRTYHWLIDKSVDDTRIEIAAGGTATFNYTVDVTPIGYTDSGWTLTGKIAVTNPNVWEAITADVTDAFTGGGVCTVVGGTGVVVPASGFVTLDYSCEFTEKPAYTETNTATATWNSGTYFTPTGTASGTAEVTLGLKGETNRSITVVDDQTDPLNPVTLGTSDYYVGPFEYTYSLKKAGVAGTCTDYTNTAVIDETDQSDSQTVKVCVGKDLTVTKTATPTFTRTWNWTITKDFDGSYDLFAGGSVTHDYKVTVTPTPVDSLWKVVGTISIENPNDWEAITLASLTDEVDNGGTCVVASGPYNIPASGTLGVTYSCTYATAPTSSNGTNTATATWDKATYFTPNASASGDKTFTFDTGSAGNPTEINPVITVDDNNLTGEEWSADRAYAEWTYTKDFACSSDPSAYTNGKYSYSLTNTAEINETGQTDTATVDVNCYAPVVSKTATTYWNRDWDWTITKDYDGSYNLFAGDTVTHGYKVAVDPTYTDNFWGVKGTITVKNPHQTEALTLTSLTDLAGGINAPVTCSSLVVPAGGTLECTYDTGTQDSEDDNPFGDTNTATAVFAGVDWTGSAAIAFSATPTTEDDPVITVDDDNLTGESWSANRAAGEWTYNKDFACSTDPADYTDGKYSYSLTNTAKINETGQTGTATVDVNCFWPQIELTKTGDELSKIGDGVNYSIKLENNTPTDAGLRALSCTISDTTIGFNKTVTLASGASDSSTIENFTIPSGASDPFLNTASVTCKPVAATAPVVGSSTFLVDDTSTWSTNLFQPKVEIIKTGPAYGAPGSTITYSFTINNLSSADSPNLMLDSVSDDVLGDLADAAPTTCDELAPGESCTFTKDYTLPTEANAYTKKNVVTVHYHPAGFPNDISDTDDHTVLVTPESQLTDTSYCPLPNNQFRLLYRLYAAPNIYLLNGSNPGQFYYNAFYYGEPGSEFTMTMEVPYPFMTQEGAGNPIQVHDGTGLTSSGCYAPYPSLGGFDILTYAPVPTSSAGNQIITPEDYTTKQMGQTTKVTVTGTVPASGVVYVTIHLDYGLKKTQPWKPTGTFTTNPVSGASIGDMSNAGLGITIHGYEVYSFSRTVGDDTVTAAPSSFNEIKKFAGFLGFVNDTSVDPVAGVTVQIYDPKGKLLVTLITDEDGYYMYLYKHTAKAATYTVKLPGYAKSVPVLVKANGFAAVDFTIP